MQRNEDAAWQRLVDLYGPLIYAWGRRSGLADEDAADIMQEVFAAVAKAIGRFDPDTKGRFRGWLWTITRNKIRDLRRRIQAESIARGGSTARRRLAELPAAELPATWDDERSDVTRQEVRALFHRALAMIQNDFQEQTWRAFWLSVIEEKPTAEIAKALGLSANGVRQAKSRVLRRLRAELGDT